uniref:Coiled-coil domain containing 142 n=1 Tax=Taeniopygia guttata TaxID=59729 RepID=A0A674G9S9_TAEGU
MGQCRCCPIARFFKLGVPTLHLPPRSLPITLRVPCPPGGSRGPWPAPCSGQRPCCARGAALHALLRHRHQLRLARDFARRLEASSQFLRRLLALPRPGETGHTHPALRELCQELRAHAGHWAALLRRLRTDAWLRAQRIEGRLRELGCSIPTSECLDDLFQGLEIYNGVVEELSPEVTAPAAFTVGEVLRLLAAERGRAVEPPALAAELQALSVLSESPELWKAVRWLDATHGPVAATLSARYRPLLWEAVGTVLADSPATPPATPSATVTAAWELSRALAVARVPTECQEELGGLCLRLLCRSVLCSWDTGVWAGPGGSGGPVRADPHPQPPRGLCPRLQVLGRCLAAVAAAHAWLTGRAGRYLAAWALPQFLLLTQGDLQVRGHSGPVSPVSPCVTLCHPCHPCHPVSQLFSGDVLWMFSTSCKRLSAEIFDQTMPLGRHWRLGPRLPSSPSAYAAAAVQAVLGQVLQGAQALPHDAQVPTLARVTTAFLEAWMDHILTRRIKFSLRRDFQAVRDLVCSGAAPGCPPEARRELRALGVFRHTDTDPACLPAATGGGCGDAPRGWGSLRACCESGAGLGVGRGSMGWDPWWDGIGWDWEWIDPLNGMGWDGMGSMGWDGMVGSMGWDGMGWDPWDGMRWDGIHGMG